MLKCDREPAMMALRNAIKVESPLEIVPEENQIGESQANGEVEGAINLIKAQIRTLRMSLQSRCACEI